VDREAFLRIVRKYGGTIETKSRGSGYYREYYEEVNLPEEIDYIISKDAPLFLKITGGNRPRIGGIGRVTSISKRYIDITFDDKKGKVVQLHYYELEPVDDTVSATRWVYNVVKSDAKPKPEVRVNKYGQELEEGTLIVGTGYGSNKGSILFGRVSRWTETSIFIKTIDLGKGKQISNQSKGDTRLFDFRETYVLPDSEDLTESFVLTKLTS